MAEDHIYVGAVEGHAVARFGSGGRTQRNKVIGATRGPEGFVWDTAEVVAIPLAEWNRYRKEYDRALRDGDLVLRDRKAWEAWQGELKRRHEVEAAAREKAAREAKETAEAPAAGSDEALGAGGRRRKK